MKFSLYQRLSFALSFVFIAIASVFYFWSEQVGEQLRYQSQQRLHLSLAANLARDNPLLQQGIYQQSSLENLFHTLMVLGPAFEFYFLDPKGNILTYSADNSLIKRDKVDLLPIITLIQNQAALPIFGDDPRHDSRTKIFSAAPVFNEAVLQGYLYVIVAGEKYDKVFNANQLNYQLKMYLGLVIAAISFLFILMLGLFRYVTEPVRRLHKDMQTVTDNDFAKNSIDSNHWLKNSNNEVNQLGCIFMNMLDKINKQLYLLKNIDNQRRELLAHLSHDLRTPLASMQGYIETLSLNSNTITEQQRQEFINIVLRNSHHLNLLIDQIFELSHLECGQVSINNERFNLGELLYDIVAKFSLQAQKANVELKVELQGSQFFINYDIAKLERVIGNLIENAIRHSNNGGCVSLIVTDIDNKYCSLAIADNGTGIKEKELPYIFDARYRASNAISLGQKHNGLGLAISKQLLLLLETDIKVESSLGKGTTFTFKLAKVTSHNPIANTSI